MQANVGRRLFLIFILTFVALIVSLPREIKVAGRSFTRRAILGRELDLKLGLDLIGGSHLVFEADLANVEEEQKKAALESLTEVIGRRVNLFGISEPNILTASFEGKERVIVELPGIYDTQQAIELVGKTAQLTFSEVEEKKQEGQEEPEQVLVPTDLTGADLKGAKVSFDQVSGESIVVIEFTDEGREKFSELTGRNVGKPLPIVLDGQLVSAPVVQDKITSSTAQITGNFELETAKELAIQLNAGALPVPIKLISERTVGATLGAESVQKSIRAGVIGLGLVLVFMVIFYGRLGLVADVGLVIFGILTLALYKIIPVVLTLPGIAGFLLSVGMAVDSNILIFERFNEEKKKGVNLIWGLEASFDRAWDSIKDANIATLVTAFVLANPFNWEFLHTSGPVRGFAITLALGIGISLFTGVFVSRNLLRFFVARK